MGKMKFEKEWNPKKFSTKKVFAHAHNDLMDYWFGWVCSPYKSFLNNKTALLHEVAHIMAPGEKHNKKWKETLMMIGGSLGSKALNGKYKLHGYVASITAENR